MSTYYTLFALFTSFVSANLVCAFLPKFAYFVGFLTFDNLAIMALIWLIYFLVIISYQLREFLFKTIK